MAAVKKRKQGRCYVQLTCVIALVKVFQFVGKVTNRSNPGHPRAAFQGMQIALQGTDITAIAVFPLVENVARRFENFFRFFKE